MIDKILEKLKKKLDIPFIDFLDEEQRYQGYIDAIEVSIKIVEEVKKGTA